MRGLLRLLLLTCAGLALSGCTLYGWGPNHSGQLGDGTLVGKLAPTKVSTADAITTGSFHTCTLRGGALWCWGENEFGQVGDGTTVDKATPTQVGTATDWKALAATSSNHTCAIRNPGTLWCWGRNSEGQVGDGTMVARPTPVQVGTATDWKSVGPRVDTHRVA